MEKKKLLGLDPEGRYNLDVIQKHIDDTIVDYDMELHYNSFKSSIRKKDVGELYMYQRRIESTLEDNKRKLYELNIFTEKDSRKPIQITLHTISIINTANIMLDNMLTVVKKTIEVHADTEIPFDGNNIISVEPKTKTIDLSTQEKKISTTAHKYAYKLHVEDSKKEIRACAREAVEKYYPEIKGNARAKKIDAIRKSLAAKIPTKKRKRTKSF